MHVTAYFQDDHRAIPNGWQRVELLSKGWKWVYLRLPGRDTRVKLARRKWNDVERAGLRDLEETA